MRLVRLPAATAAALLLAGCAQDPTPRSPTPVEPQLRKLDGVYAAKLSHSAIRRLDLATPAPAGVWKIAIRAGSRTLEVSAPEGPHTGGYTLDITGIRHGTLTLAPDRTCERRPERARPAKVAYSLRRSTLVFTYAQGGCESAWLLLRATPWSKA